MRLELWTAEPGLQLFDASAMTIAVPGLDGQTYGPFAGLCLEAQHFPDSLNNPDWPSIICTPEDPYLQRLEVEIARRRVSSRPARTACPAVQQAPRSIRQIVP